MEKNMNGALLHRLANRNAPPMGCGLRQFADVHSVSVRYRLSALGVVATGARLEGTTLARFLCDVGAKISGHSRSPQA